MKVAFIIAVVCALIAATYASSLWTEDSLRSEFGTFVVKYDRKYSTELEYEQRFQIFKANVLGTDELNRQSKTAKFGVTKFSDWSQAEREAYLGKLPKDRRGSRQQASKQVLTAAPPSFDLVKQGVVESVKNQGQCGSCWAFSTVYSIASSAFKAGVSPQIADQLSPQQIVDCTVSMSGCNGGDLPPAYDYLEEFGGIQTLESYPYTARDGRCANNATKIAVPVKGFEWVIPDCEYTDCNKQDTVTLLNKVVQRGVAPAICVTATNAWFDFQGGIFDLKCANGYYSLNHCVGLSGYNAEEGYVTIQNSWGESWGTNGRMNIKYDQDTPNLCGWADEVTFALV